MESRSNNNNDGDDDNNNEVIDQEDSEKEAYESAGSRFWAKSTWTCKYNSHSKEIVQVLDAVKANQGLTKVQIVTWAQSESKTEKPSN